MKIRISALAFALIALISVPAGAATVNPVVGLQVDRSNGLQVYQLRNGNYLGLWTINNREGINPGAGEVVFDQRRDLLDGFVVGRDKIRGIFNGSNPVNPGAPEFSRVLWNFTIADNALLRGALWIEWTGGRLTYQQPAAGRQASINSRRVTLQGDPVTVVPVPAAMPLLLVGLGALGVMARRRRAS